MLVEFKCCCACGVPIKKVNGVSLHTDGFAQRCTMPRFFFQAFCKLAEQNGDQPHERLRRVLTQGSSHFVTTKSTIATGWPAAPMQTFHTFRVIRADTEDALKKSEASLLKCNCYTRHMRFSMKRTIHWNKLLKHSKQNRV